MTDPLDQETRKKVDELTAQGRYLEAVELLRTGERRHKLAPGECQYCDRERAAGSSFHPSHDASSTCKSGKHSHCTCDSCF